jgi:hypothetical protein
MARIFISHIHEDQQAALYLATFLRTKLKVDPSDIFLSSNQQITLGSEWLQAIGKAFTQATIIIALFSQEAMNRQWVHFEAGGAFFAKNKFLIPLCIGGVRPVDLGKPYANIQGADLHEWTTSHYLVNTIAKKLRPEIKDLPIREFSREDEAVKVMIQGLDAWKLARAGSLGRRKGDPPPPLVESVGLE